MIVAFILAFGFFIFFFARMRQENLEATVPVAGRIVDVESVDGESSGGGRSGASQRARINPEWGETFLDAIDMNLDEDEDLEQVLIVKPSSMEGGKISIVVADFQPTTGNYFRLWKGETLATKPNAVVVQPRDLLDDGSVDLLCFGIDDSNRQTLTVFKRSPSGSAAAYYQAFSESGLSITVDDPTEVPPLSAGKKTAAISVFEEAPGGSSPLDQKKISYTWVPSKKSFMRGEESFVPGEHVEQVFISKILTGVAEDFESYLGGLWQKDNGPGSTPTYVYFDPAGRKVSIHSEQEQQQWDWGSSNTAFAGIYTPISNSAVPEMIRLLGINLVGVDRVRIGATTQQIVKFAMKEDWNGVYTRSTGESAPLKRSAFQKAQDSEPFMVSIDGTRAELATKPEDFEGFYASEVGTQLELKAGKFNLVQSKSSSKGYYSLFRLGDSAMLDLGLLDDKSIPSGRLSYIISLKPGKNGRLSTLILKPARILSDRAEPLFKPDIQLEKVEN